VLTDLRLKNFKPWRDTGPVRLAPLTFFFGTNSSGKSSLHQFLLMLRQTAESPDRRRVLHTGDASTPVDLGSYIDLVHGRDPSRALEFELGWRLPEPLEVVDARSGAATTGEAMSFRARVEARASTPPRVHVAAFRYRLHRADGQAELALGLERAGEKSYRVTAEGFRPVPAAGREGPVAAPSHFHAFPDELRTRYQNLEFASDLVFALEDRLSSLAYLGPLRERPGRLYRWTGEEPEHVGWRGERTVDALLAGESRGFHRTARHARRPLQVVVAQWLERLDVIDAFTVVPIGRGRDEYEVRVRAPGSRQEVLLTDVGFGVSQVLPVVTQCFYSPPKSTLILEQPEIHLHPAVQSGLGDLFIEAAAMMEDGAPRDLQLIVESHSEHLLRRLLRRIADETLDPRAVALYFVRPGRAGAVIEPLEVDELGNVRNWPEKFFGDPATDMVEQTRHARRRRQRGG
jgi:predicted ATPase